MRQKTRLLMVLIWPTNCEKSCGAIFRPITGKSSTTNFVRITSLPVDKSTVKNLSKAGRLRWKIENEGFNGEKKQWLQHGAFI
ncbi:MAG TPA: hypothetical protein PKV73_04155 [Agriterribacter sp.]|nr:hypothetical protein [Chitinophagaceae bacterium]HRP31052.1 hypothetical protein [Agriterribacter sp.]